MWCESPSFWAGGVVLVLIVVYVPRWVSWLRAERQRWQCWDDWQYVERLVLCQRLQAALQRLIANNPKQLKRQLRGSELSVIKHPWWLVLHPAITADGVDWQQTKVVLGRVGGGAFGTPLYNEWDELDVDSITAILRPCDLRWATKDSVLFTGAFAYALAEASLLSSDTDRFP